GDGVQVVALLISTLAHARQALGAIRRVGHRQVTGALRIQQEQRTEYEQQRRRLELLADRVLADVAALSLRPATQLAAQDRQYLLTKDAIQPQPQLLTVVPRLLEHRTQLALGEI